MCLVCLLLNTLDQNFLFVMRAGGMRADWKAPVEMLATLAKMQDMKTRLLPEIWIRTFCAVRVRVGACLKVSGSPLLRRD